MGIPVHAFFGIGEAPALLVLVAALVQWSDSGHRPSTMATSGRLAAGGEVERGRATRPRATGTPSGAEALLLPDPPSSLGRASGPRPRRSGTGEGRVEGLGAMAWPRLSPPSMGQLPVSR